MGQLFNNTSKFQVLHNDWKWIFWNVSKICEVFSELLDQSYKYTSTDVSFLFTNVHLKRKVKSISKLNYKYNQNTIDKHTSKKLKLMPAERLPFVSTTKIYIQYWRSIYRIFIKSSLRKFYNDWAVK